MSLPCSCRQRNNVLQTFLRVNEDAELRIAAYLAAMQCPTEGVVQQVRDALLSEEVNQVSRNVSSVCVNQKAFAKSRRCKKRRHAKKP